LDISAQTTSASGTYTYTYEVNSGYSDNSGYDVAWAKRTVIQKPDSSYLTQYFDELGQGISTVVTDLIPSNGSAKTWVTRVERDSTTGYVKEVRMPDNLDISSPPAYVHSTAAMPSYTGDGLVRVFTRESTGDLTGFVTVQTYKKGTSGTAYYERATSWDATTLTKVLNTDVKVVRPLVAVNRPIPSGSCYERLGTMWNPRLPSMR